MRPEITTIVLAALAVVLGIVAYLKDPGLPLVRVVPSLAFPILAGWLVHVFVQD
jgi:hypothetical protein